MVLTCDICGKKIFTVYPDNWPYRHGGKFFCSENCRIVHAARDLHKIEYIRFDEGLLTGYTPVTFGQQKEKEERKNDMRGKPLLEENNQKAIELAMEGKDPIAYLKECGAKNPWGNWGYIKMKLQKKDPEKYQQVIEAEAKRVKKQAAVVEKTDKLPEEAQKPKVPEPLNGGKWEKAAEEAEQAAQAISEASLEMRTTATTKQIEKVIGHPLNSLVYKVIGIETKLGKFQYDAGSDQLRWMPFGSTVVVMMPADDWKKLAEDLPKVMETIGAGSREDDEE